MTDVAEPSVVKTVLITGAAGGIGKALVATFASAGHRLVLVGRSPNVIDLASTLDGEHLGLVADIADDGEAVAVVARAIDAFGRVDILVNNAAVAPLGTAETFSTPDFDLTLAVNLRAPFILSRESARGMLAAGWGRIVNIASQAAIIAIEGHVAYCASKAGLIGLTQVMAIEWAGRGITVNAVSPTIVATALAERNWVGERGDTARRAIPAGRFATPEEVASTVRFLAGTEAAMINGANIVVDGGNTIR